MLEHLFVYGTLMSGMEASYLLSDIARPAGRGHVQGRLYDLGEYPALLPGEPGDIVWGEVYRILRPAAIRQIDRYEGFDPSEPYPLYRREATWVRLEDGATLLAWAYVYNRPLPAGARHLPSGDYRRAGQREAP
jgi:gamma-glutamylcyclotransferase (GGCT)/AIG2-like uncharacterized protein YtfP